MKFLSIAFSNSWLAVFVLLFTFLAARDSGAQSSSATLGGFVTDTGGAPMLDANVALVSTTTGARRETNTASSGTYSILDLRPGEYAIQVSKAGFSTIVQPNVVLEVNQTASLNFRMALAGNVETITVTGQLSPVESATTELGTVISGQLVNNLPLNGRNFTEMLSLATGVSPVSVAQNANGGGFAGNAVGTAIFPAVNGQRNRSNMFLLDGVNDLAYLSNYNYAPIVDEIREFKVQSENDLAEFGQVTGGIVNLATKGGTNTLHGSAWEFVRNEQFDARNYFLPARNPLRQNQFGVTVGGPVYIPRLYDGRNKTFFFFAFEGFRQSQAAQSIVLAPTTAQLKGDFSGLLSEGIQLYNPYSTRPDPSYPGQYLRDPFLKNDISGYLSAPALLYAKTLLPVGGSPVSGGNLFDTTKSIKNQSSFGGRIDQTFGNHDTVFGRISHFSQPSSNSAGYPGAENRRFLNGWNATVQGSHIFGSNRVLDARFGRNLGRYTTTVVFPKAPTDFADSLISAGFSDKFLSNFSSVPGSLIPLITIAGYASTAGSNILDLQTADTYEFGADFTTVLGRHTLKAGYGYQTDSFYTPNVGSDEGTTSFQTSNLESLLGPSGKGTGDALASFLIGVPSSSYRRDVLEQLHNGSVQSGYLQDQFKVTPQLSLNMGVRYDLAIWPVYGYFANGQGYVGDLDLSNGTYILSGKPAPCSINVGAPCIPTGTLPANVVVTQNANHAIHITDRNNWQGRLGVAYRVADWLSIRSGYSRFYDEWNGLSQFAQNVGGNWPSVGSFNINSQNTTVPTAGIDDPLSLSQGALSYPSASPFTNASFYFNPRLKTPYVDQWNIGINQQVATRTTLTLVYAGSHASRLDSGGLNNTAEYPGPGSAAIVAARRRYPSIAPSRYDDSTGNSNYHSLQTRLSQSSSNGLTYLLSYTWSKSIDLGCSGDFGVEGCMIQDPYHPRADRSVSGFDLTHLFSASGVSALPFGKGKRWDPSNPIARYAVSNWRLSGIVSLYSGTPYYVTYSGDLANTGNTFVKADVIGNPRPAHPKPSEWINPSSFAPPRPYTFGTMGRNSLRSDWYKNLDLSLVRVFEISSDLNLEFRVDAFNLTNTPVFAAPNHVINTPAFGVVTSTANTPRELQLGLKLNF